MGKLLALGLVTSWMFLACQSEKGKLGQECNVNDDCSGGTTCQVNPKDCYGPDNLTYARYCSKPCQTTKSCEPAPSGTSVHCNVPAGVDGGSGICSVCSDSI